MLDLTDKRWQELKDSYGRTLTIPNFLKGLHDNNQETSKREWADFIGSLVPPTQASYASVPHLIHLVVQRNIKDRAMYLFAIGMIEVNRFKGEPIDDLLQPDYFTSLEKVANLTLECLTLNWEEEDFRMLMATLAIMRGKHRIAAWLIDGPAGFDEWPDEC